MTRESGEHATTSTRGSVDAWRRGSARRFRVCFAIVASLALCTVSLPGHASELGVNYNGVTRTYRRADVAATAAKWVRAFVDVRKLQRAGADAIASDPDLAAIARMHDDGYRVILNLKFDFRDASFPSDPTSPEFLALRAFTTQLLNQVFPDVDIIVVGNEPFIESTLAKREARRE